MEMDRERRHPSHAPFESHTWHCKCSPVSVVRRREVCDAAEI